jgi:hypothetical protein
VLFLLKYIKKKQTNKQKKRRKNNLLYIVKDKIKSMLMLFILFVVDCALRVKYKYVVVSGRPPGPEMENCIDRESYSLAAGLALGLVMFGVGIDKMLLFLLLLFFFHFFLKINLIECLTQTVCEERVLPG